MIPSVKSLLPAVTLLLATSCAPVSGPDKSLTGAVLGAAWGAGAGAVVGNQTGNMGPGAAAGAGFGAVAGLLTGMGLDVIEGEQLRERRQLNELKVQVASNRQALITMHDTLDDRVTGLRSTDTPTQIYFDKGRASIRLGSAIQIERAAQRIKNNPYVGMVELHGHSDEMGSAEENKRLSEARARTVASILVAHGVSSDQVKIVGHGSTQPLASNQSEAGRQLNRRVELVLRR